MSDCKSRMADSFLSIATRKSSVRQTGAVSLRWMSAANIAVAWFELLGGFVLAISSFSLSSILQRLSGQATIGMMHSLAVGVVHIPTFPSFISRPTLANRTLRIGHAPGSVTYQTLLVRAALPRSLTTFADYHFGHSCSHTGQTSGLMCSNS